MSRPASLAGQISEWTKEALEAAQRELLELALSTGIAKTPVGGARDDHAGRMKRHWTFAPNNLQSAIEHLQPVRLVNTAAEALVIDLGRRPIAHAYDVKKPHPRHIPAGRMIGSSQAPLGVRGDVVRVLDAAYEEIVRRAEAAASAKVGAA